MEKEVRAFSEIQIWAHKHLIHFTILLILTGLPMIEREYFGWIAELLGAPLYLVIGGDSFQVGISVARVLHRFAAVGLGVVVVVLMVGEISRIRKWEILPECWSLTCLVRGIKQLVGYYIGKRRQEFGKYNLGQKAWGWAAALGALVMLITGTILWFRNYFPYGLWYLAFQIHQIGFFLAVIGVIVHAYMAIAIPEHRPYVTAMFRTGLVSEEFIREHNPRWYEKLKGK